MCGLFVSRQRSSCLSLSTGLTRRYVNHSRREHTLKTCTSEPAPLVADPRPAYAGHCSVYAPTRPTSAETHKSGEGRAQGNPGHSNSKEGDQVMIPSVVSRTDTKPSHQPTGCNPGPHMHALPDLHRRASTTGCGSQIEAPGWCL